MAVGSAPFAWPMTDQVRHVVGIDLGKTKDYTALVDLERRQRVPAEIDDPRSMEDKINGVPRPDPPSCEDAVYSLRVLKRWPLQTSYTSIVADVKKFCLLPALGKPTLAIDRTGVGCAVLEMFTAAGINADIEPILITGGHEVSQDLTVGGWHVPKKELVSALQVILQSRRLQIANIPERKLLIDEMDAFRVKVTDSANETFEAWRERDHDDCVLATAIAAWIGEQWSEMRVIVVTAPEVDWEARAHPWHY